MRPNAKPSNSAARGQAVLMMAVSIPLMFGVLGLAVHSGWNYWRSESCKTAAQAAAFAAARQAQLSGNLQCGAGVECQSSPASCPGELTPVPGSNLMAGCNYAGANGFTNRGNVVVEYQAGTGKSPVTGPAPAYWVRFTITEKAPLYLAAVLGEKFANPSAHATAAVFAGEAGQSATASLIE